MAIREAEAEGLRQQGCTEAEIADKPEADLQTENPKTVLSQSQDEIAMVTSMDTDMEKSSKNQPALESTVNEGVEPKRDKLDGVKERKIAALKTSLARQEADLALLQSKLEGLNGKIKNPPSSTVKQHITLLHTYNEIRDIGQGLIGMVVEQRNSTYNHGSSSTQQSRSDGAAAAEKGEGGREGFSERENVNLGNLRVRDVYEEFGLGVDD